MKEMISKIQASIDTLQALEIKATYANMDHMMGVLHVLASVRDELTKMYKDKETEEKEDGNADAE